MTPQLPLMVALANSATDDPLLTPGNFALPVGSVTVTPELGGSEETLLSGRLTLLEGSFDVRALTIRVNVPADHPIPRALGERWARFIPGTVLGVAETYTDRSARSSYTNARVTSNTVAVSLQKSLTEAYYSGSIELRVLLER